jgi:hypothetical protein
MSMPASANTITMPDRDRKLIALCERWFDLKAEYERLWNAEQDKWESEGIREPEHVPSDDFYSENVYPLDNQIEELQPTTLAGVASKAQFIKVYYENYQVEDVMPFFDELIALGNKKAA